jgi:hypothetical protein
MGIDCELGQAYLRGTTGVISNTCTFPDSVIAEGSAPWDGQDYHSHFTQDQLYMVFAANLRYKKDPMKDSMVDRLDDHEPVTITEALEIPQPRAVGSPLPRGNGGRVSIPPTYADLEDRNLISHPGPVLAPSPTIGYGSPLLSSAAPAIAPAQAPEPPPVNAMPELAAVPSPSPVSAAAPAPAPTAVPPLADAEAPVRKQAVPSAPPVAPQERPRALQPRTSSESSSPLQRAAAMIRQVIPVVQKLLPLLDGNLSTVVSNILAPPPPPAPPARPEPPPTVDLAPIKEHIAELRNLQNELREQMIDQNNSLKRVEDHLELVREATDRNTLEQQELMEDLKSMGSKVNVVAAVAIGLLAISLLVNMALYMHIQKVLP